MFVLTRALGSRFSAFFVSGTYGTVGMALLALFGLATGKLGPSVALTLVPNVNTLWWFFGEIVIGLSIYGQTAQAYALRILPAGTTSLISSYGTLVVGVTGAIVLLGETIAPSGYFAGVLLAVALALALVPVRANRERYRTTRTSPTPLNNADLDRACRCDATEASSRPCAHAIERGIRRDAQPVARASIQISCARTITVQSFDAERRAGRDAVGRGRERRAQSPTGPRSAELFVEATRQRREHPWALTGERRAPWPRGRHVLLDGRRSGGLRGNLQIGRRQAMREHDAAERRPRSAWRGHSSGTLRVFGRRFVGSDEPWSGRIRPLALGVTFARIGRRPRHQHR